MEVLSFRSPATGPIPVDLTSTRNPIQDVLVWMGSEREEMTEQNPLGTEPLRNKNTEYSAGAEYLLIHLCNWYCSDIVLVLFWYYFGIIMVQVFSLEM